MSGPEPSAPGSEPQTPGTNWQAPPAQTGGFQTAPIAPGPAAGIAYADLVTRAIAYIIDAVILGIGYAIVASVLFASLFITGGFGGVWAGVVVFGLIFLAVSAVYFVYTWTTMRASPGQKILNLETVNAADGSTLTQNQAMLRWVYLFGPQALGTVFSQATGAGYAGVSTLGSLFQSARVPLRDLPPLSGFAGSEATGLPRQAGRYGRRQAPRLTDADTIGSRTPSGVRLFPSWRQPGPTWRLIRDRCRTTSRSTPWASCSDFAITRA